MSTTGLREHTSHDFESELNAVRVKLMDMSRQVDAVVEASGRALIGRDVALANEIIVGDDQTDDMELEIDHLCLQILARRQPVAGDLRLLTSALKLVVDLERIGDLGVSIATRVVELDSTPPPISFDEILPMLTMARQMVSESLGALVTGEVSRARSVIDKDEILDTTYAYMFHQIVSRMRDASIDVANATRVQAITKYIERIGDHAVNIAERVIFVLTGEDVRHQPRLRRSELS